MLKNKLLIFLGIGYLFLCSPYAQPAAAAPVVAGGFEEWQFNDQASPELVNFDAFVKQHMPKTDTATGTASAAAALSNTILKTLFPRLDPNLTRAFIEKFAKITHPFEGLDWCECAMADRSNRIFISLKQVNDIVGQYRDKTAPIIHTTFGAGHLLQAYLLVDALVTIGEYQNIVINAIDTTFQYREQEGYVDHAQFFKNLCTQYNQKSTVTLNTYTDVFAYINAVATGTPSKSHSYDMIDIGGGAEMGIDAIEKPANYIVNETAYGLQGSIFIYHLTQPKIKIALIYTKNLPSTKKDQASVDMLKQKLAEIFKESETTKQIADSISEFSKQEGSPLKFGYQTEFKLRHTAYPDFTTLIEQTKANDNPIIYELGNYDSMIIRKHTGTYHIAESLNILSRQKSAIFFNPDDKAVAAVKGKEKAASTASAAGAARAARPTQWECPVCTLLNDTHVDTCAVCGATKPSKQKDKGKAKATTADDAQIARELQEQEDAAAAKRRRTQEEADAAYARELAKQFAEGL